MLLIDVAAVARTIDGWLSEPQGRALYHAAKMTRGRGVIVEIGSWKGRSTVWLAAGAQAVGRRIYAIDPHCGSRENPAANTLAEFQENIRRAGLADVVEPLVMTSIEAAATIADPVELLFIDGDHSLQGARQDAEIWLPRLVCGGVVLMHDVGAAGYVGPRDAFRRMVCWNRGFHRIRRIGSMGLAYRTERRGLAGAAWGAAAGALLYFYDLKRWFGGWRRDCSTGTT